MFCLLLHAHSCLQKRMKGAFLLGQVRMPLPSLKFVTLIYSTYFCNYLALLKNNLV